MEYSFFVILPKQVRQADLLRVGEAGTEVYAAASAVARASRALRNYPTGALEAKREVDLAVGFARDSHNSVARIAFDLAGEPHLKNDFFTKNVGEYIFSQGNYPFVHPSKKNIF